MLPEDVLDKLQYFNCDKYEVSDNEVTLVESKKSGKAVLRCILNKDTLILHKPEENTLTYLDESKKGAKAGPDEFLFELDQDGEWILHIVEFKKSITTDSVKKSKIQFVMGIYNARAIAAFLNMKIKSIIVYSAYRNDKIRLISEDVLIQMRYANSDSNNLKIIKEWKKGKCTLEVDLKELKFEHKQIKLDNEGNGEYILSPQ